MNILISPNNDKLLKSNTLTVDQQDDLLPRISAFISRYNIKYTVNVLKLVQWSSVWSDSLKSFVESYIIYGYVCRIDQRWH